MPKNIKTILLLFVILLFFLSLWNYLQRKKMAKGENLEMRLSIVGIEKSEEEVYNPYSIELEIEFHNNSLRTIVFKKPRSVGFNNISSIRNFQPVFNDIGLILARQDGKYMENNPSSQFMVNPPAKTIMDVYLFHAPSDFVSINPGDSYLHSVKIELPIVYLEDNDGDKIPAGTYILYAGYDNSAIGYNIYNPKEFSITEIVDLNAWVGKLTSNKVEFEIEN